MFTEKMAIKTMHVCVCVTGM